MSILIIGSEGSMGKRYQAILSYLGKSYECMDIHNCERSDLWQKASSFVIATPTPTHLKLIRMCIPFGKPILCEKPLSTDTQALLETLHEVKASQVNLTTMFQYQMMGIGTSGHSHYDYFRHGNDGLAWDCFQIISLAKGEISLGETSPVWRCTINGNPLYFQAMDWAYIKFVEKWLMDPGQDPSFLADCHYKVAEYARGLAA
jgi:hypothetical protein